MNSKPSPVHRGLLALALLGCASLAVAGGDVKPLSGHDLSMEIDYRWPGCHHGGYFPIRVDVLNRGESRTFTFRFRPDENLPTVERTVDLAQNGSDRFSLSVPMVGRGFDGVVEVLQDGQPLDKMAHHIDLPQADPGSVRPAIVIVGGRGIDPTSLENGVGMLGNEGLHVHHGYGMSEDHEILPPSALPRNWIDYSGLDIVTVPMSFFETPDDERRDVIDAILKWVDTGGTLIVHELTERPENSAELRRAIGLDVRTAVSDEWRNLLPELVQHDFTLNFARANAIQNADFVTDLLIEVAGQEEVDVDEALIELTGDEESARPLRTAAMRIVGSRDRWHNQYGTRWAGRGVVPFVRDVGLGRVVAITGDAFVGTPVDWTTLLRTMLQSHAVLGDNPANLTWPARHGINARAVSDDFDRFLIPGVRSVPVMSFLVLITLFTLVIGPLNYYLLWRRGRLNLLVVTIPLVAFGTSLALFAYSTVAHGFSVQSRVRSVTLLDQGNKTSVTTSRVALFAGMAPSDGLAFAPETAVSPIWPSPDSFRGAHVDWTNGQSFDSGWLRSRTRTQFLVVQHEPARVHVNVEEPQGDLLPIDNNLVTDDTVEFLLVRGGDGRFYAAENVPAGKRVHLPLATDADLSRLSVLLKRNPMEAYQSRGFGGGGFSSRNDHYGHGHDAYGSNTYVRYSGNSAERLVARAGRPTYDREDFPANGYVAILSENPNVDIGLESTRGEAGFHLVLGYH